MDKLARWPLLVAAVILIATAITMDITQGDRQFTLAIAILVLGAGAMGAFMYAEGIRWRERRDQAWEEAHHYADHPEHTENHG